ncbi:MAG: hypothetical protein ABJO01_15165 [Parasphingorhabdus sp.]|uniref:hypothetical protein n=1 Tax=Parasphingorhabdus sp. TaxID=2709688 RepID=UPI003299BB90
MRSVILTILILSHCATIPLAHSAEQKAVVPSPLETFDPEAPPKEGQPLITWRRPAILDYEIAPTDRSNLSACDETDFFFLDDIARKCDPILAMTKLYVQLDFATYEARSRHRKQSDDAAEYREKALVFAEQITSEFGQPQWPLQRYLLSKTYQSRASLYSGWQEWDKAIAEQDKRIALLSRSRFKARGSLLAQAYQQKGGYLLAKGDRSAAQANYETSFALNQKNAFQPFSAIRYHTEAMVQDAIHERDYDYALQWIDRYLDIYRQRAQTDGQSGPFDGELLLERLVALRIYILAETGNASELMQATTLFDTLYKDRRYRCSKFEMFPQVVAPYHKDKRIKSWLESKGCSEKIFRALDDVPKKGVIGYGRRILLPPHRP